MLGKTPLVFLLVVLTLPLASSGAGDTLRAAGGRPVMPESTEPAAAGTRPAGDDAPDAKGEKVLIINSYHIGYEWSDDIMSSIEDVINANRPGVEMYFEYLDSKRFPLNAERADVLAAMLAAKYRDIGFDAVIVSDDIAYHFILDRRDLLFPGVPVVFCGVNDFDPREITPGMDVTGVAQTVEFGGNVELIQKILPDLKQLYVVVDNSMTGRAYRRAFEKDLTIPAGIDIQYLDGSELSWDDLISRLGDLPPYSAVLTLVWLEDRDGHYYPQSVSYPAMAAESAVPVFQVTESGFGLGLAGGLMVTGRSQGRRAALMAIDILSGHPVSSIPVIIKAESEMRIDWNALSKSWGVTRADFQRNTAGADVAGTTQPRPIKTYFRVCLSNEPVVSSYNILTGGFTGLAVELMEVLAGRSGWRFSYVYIEPDRMLVALNRNQCDLAMPVTTDEATLEKLDLSSQPLYSNWGAVYVREGASFAGLRDLQGKSVAVVAGSAFSTPFTRQVNSLGLNITYVWVDSYKDAVNLLVSREVDAALVSRLHPISAREASRVIQTDIIIYPTGQRVAVLKGTNPGLIAYFDQYLSELKGESGGDYDKVLARYTFKPNVRWVPPWVWVVLVAFIVALAFVFMLRRQVFAKTAEVRNREENIRVILDSIGDAVIAADAGGIIRQINPVACRLTEWIEAEAIGRPLSEVFDVVEAGAGESSYAWVGEVLAGNTFRRSSDESPSLQPRHGRDIRVEVSASPIRGREDRVQGLVIVFSDVTESLRTEEARRQSQKMEAIGQLAGGIAHDFNNILGGIVGIAEFLISRYREDPTILKYCGHIVESGHRASAMTRRLLDFARMGKEESVPLSVNAVITSAAELLKRSIPRNIEIKTSLKAHPDVIVGDASQIENLVLNLGINARDAMPDGGRIDVSTSCSGRYLEKFSVGRFELASGSYLILKVADTGSGISEGARERIFEPFFTTKTTGKGTGLGLAAVMGIVEEHQGAIEVESNPAGGTVFTIYLPLTEAEQKVEPELSSYEASSYQGVVLVIDDEPLIRTMAEVLLTESGFDVITAGDGREGLETYMKRHDEIDVVLLDFIMPVMDGLATLRELKAFDPDVRVVIASGFTNEHRKQTFLDAGAWDAVNKPFSQQEICSALTRALNHH